MSLGKHNETRNKTSSTVKNLKKKKIQRKYTNVEREKIFQNIAYRI